MVKNAKKLVSLETQEKAYKLGSYRLLYFIKGNVVGTIFFEKEGDYF